MIILGIDTSLRSSGYGVLQIQRMVKTLLALDELPQNDAADALALAITHAHAHSPLNPREPL